MAASKRTSAPQITSIARRRATTEPTPSPLPAPSRVELACAFSQALDLAEGRRLGHATRVAYIALNLAQSMGLTPEQQRVALYAALLHDAGAAAASAEVCRTANLSEETVFRAGPEESPQRLALEIAPSNVTAVVELLRAHPEHGAQVARDLGLERPVQQAIVTHHERWDGHGYPQALKGDAAPIGGRLVAAADLIESIISNELHALAARRNLLSALDEHAGHALDAELVALARELSRSDAFWLGLYSHDLVRELPESCEEALPEAERSPVDLQTFASVFATLADAKGEHTTHHSRRTAELVDRLAEALDFTPARRELVRIAALLHDVGLLGVPAQVIAKPDILSLTEMEIMRQHPAYSQLVLEAVPGLEEAAHWVGAHHERPDGKGYPETLEQEQIPLEARIIALADTYVALTSARPYRRALAHDDAEQVLLGGAGTQLDGKLVRLLCSLSLEPRSSRTAPRSRRRR